MKSTTRISSALLALTAALLSNMPASAVTIDSFTTNQTAVADPPGTTPTVVTGGADIIGTRRAIDSNLLALPTGIGAGPVSTSVSGGALSFAVTATTPDSRGEGILTWDGDATAGNLNMTGLSGVNLTAGSQNALHIRVNSAGAGTEIVFDVYSNVTAASRGFLRIPTAVAAPTSFFLTYQYDFVAIAAGPADFANVGAIQMRIRGTEVAASIDLIETVGPSLTASKRDLDLANSPIAAPVLEGATFKYRITVTGQNGLADNVDLNDTVDANTALNAASIRVTPVAIDDAYVTVGHVGRSVAAPGLLANDIDPDTVGALPELVLAAGSVGTFATALGGSITTAADGSFTYEPPVGVNHAVDTFTYTVQDNDGQTSTGQFKVAIGSKVWFVEDAHPGLNLGTRNNPFVGFTATNLNGAGGAGDQDHAGDIVFLHTGTHTATFALENDQQVIGEGDGLTIDGQNIIAAGTDPVLTSSGHGIVLATNNTLRGFTIGGTGNTSFDVFGANFGTLTTSNLELNGAGGGMSLDTGVMAVTLDSLTTTAASHGLNLNAVSGSLTVAGATTIASTTFGIRSNASGTAVYNFNGLVGITTSAGTGIFGSTGGTFNITGSSNGVNATGGPALDLTSTSLGSGATFSLVTSTNSTGKGINFDSVTGAFTATGGTVSNPAGIGVDINAGSSNFSYSGGVTSTAANRLVEITSRTGGTVTLSGTLSGSGATHTGINVASNSGGTINFSGSSKTLNTVSNTAVTLASNAGATINFTGNGLDIDTTSGAGFSATGGGTVSVQGTSNTVDSTTGTSLNVTSTTIAAAGLTFQRISANGAASAIILSSTGSSGGLTVSGTGGVDSGGVILNTTGDAISLNTTQAVNLSHMRLENNLGNGIRGESVTGLNLTSVRAINNADNDALDEAGIHLTNLLGSSNWTSIEVADSLEDNVRVINSGSNHLTQLTITNSTIRDTSNVSPGNNGLLIQADGSANMTADIVTTDFLRNRANGVQVINNGSGALDVEIGGAGSDFTDNNIGVNIAHNGAGSLAFDVTSGTFNSTLASPINLNLGGASTVGSLMSGTVSGNVIDNNESLTGPGIRVTTNGAGTLTVLLQNNNITEVANRGIEMIARDGSSTLNATLHGNVVNLASALAADAVHIAAGAVTTDTVKVCADINGDNVVANQNSVFSNGNHGIRVRQRFTGTTFTLEDYAGGATDMTAVQNFLAARNAGGDTYFADFGGTGFGSAANCPMP